MTKPPIDVVGESENALPCGRYARTEPALLRGPCITCGAEDCLPITRPWAVPLIY
jgi:hypothetical protein